MLIMVELRLDYARVRVKKSCKLDDKVLDFDCFIFDLVIFLLIGVYDDVFDDLK